MRPDRSVANGFTPSWRSAEHGIRSSWRSAEHGFTLVEVLVALVVTSLLLAIVMNAALQAKTRGLAALDKEEAVTLARGLLAARAVSPFDPAARTGEAGGLRWTVAERQVAIDPRRLLLLSEMKVDVRNARGAALSSLSLRRLKKAPEQ